MNSDHYYTHNSKRYENMKELRKALGIAPKAFRFKVKADIYKWRYKE